MKTRRPVALVFTLLGLLGVSRANAKLLCQDCGCALYCSTTCTTSSGGTSTCGASGAQCRGGCGCLPMAEAAFLLDFAREAEQRTAAVEPRIGAVAARLTLRIAGFVEERGLGVVFAPATGFGGQAAGGMWPPDLAFVRGQEGRSTEVVGKLVPQLIAQILPNVGAKNAVEEEARAWLASGTRIVLVLDPFAATVTVYRDGAKPRFLGAEDVLEVPEVLPGWAVPVAELFG